MAKKKFQIAADDKFARAITITQKNGEKADVRYSEYGQFLSEEDIKFINE